MFHVVFSDGTAPKVIEGLKDSTAEVKKDITLKCKIDPGKPKATAEWYLCTFYVVNSFIVFADDFKDRYALSFLCAQRNTETNKANFLEHLRH